MKVNSPLSFTTTVNSASVVEYEDRIVVKVHCQSLVISAGNHAEDKQHLLDLQRAIDKALERWS